VNEPDALIANALREIADQAAAPPRLADAAWRAGQRRRRLGVMATSAAAATGAIAIAVVLSLTVAGGAGRSGDRGVPPLAAASVRLRTPLRFEQVAAVSHAPCTAGEMPGIPPGTCVRLSGTGMAITSAESARVPRPNHGQNVLDIRLTPADSPQFAALTRKLAVLHIPRNNLAIIVRGRVVSQPMVIAAVTAGRAQIVFGTHAQAERVLRSLISR
jgi:SecD-like export protein